MSIPHGLVPVIDKDAIGFHSGKGAHLGKGGFADVVKADWRKHPSLRPVTVAVKRLLKRHTPLSELERVEHEADLLHALEHPHILGIIGVVLDTDGHAKWIVMELAQGSVRGHLQELRERGAIVHLDVKPDNILIVGQGSDVVYKLGDVGVAKFANSLGIVSVTSRTKEYSAPEVLSRSKADGKADLYSLGVTVVEIVLGFMCTPFTVDVLTHYKKCGGFPAAVADATTWLAQQSPQGTALAALLTRCCEKDPKARPSSSEALTVVEDIIASLRPAKPARATPSAKSSKKRGGAGAVVEERREAERGVEDCIARRLRHKNSE